MMEQPAGWQIRYTHAPTKTTYTVNDWRTGRPFTTLLAAETAARIMGEDSDNGYYPIADSEVLPHGMESRALVRAVPTGEYRIPRQGEWFLSGASVEAYQAHSDFMTTEYHIAKLVKGALVWIHDRSS